MKFVTIFLFFFLFLLYLILRKEYSKVSCHSHMTKSHKECEKIVHRPCSSCISSVQEINKDFIEFSLLTWTWSRFKLSWLKPYNFILFPDSSLG